MSEKYKFDDPEGRYFVTLSIVHWIDLFTRKEFKHSIVESLKYCQNNKGLVINAWCLMPSHLHMIIRSDSEPVGAIIRDFKKFTSRQAIELLGTINESRKEWLLRAFKASGEKLKRITSYKVWQDGNPPELLMSNKFQEQKLTYIHYNPVECEIVDEPEYYWYSSARDYSGINVCWMLN
ncbi:REP-associated tyrosine transposase [Fulvivirga ligni]|uniref:REP-associated tyrosine transposase n=1 Tax=Fulvivirga ligni TaxID=2904246 RepID=UPI001F473E5C|nr:transposase [Fulvivirga ligni]UII20005.1 transposase [Fulvivirga ligni]